jgi:multiple antibiotic resistance protein
MENFWLCFVPLFVAMDAIGLLPIYISMTDGFSVAQQRKIIVQSVLTALIVSVLFLFGGQWLFQRLGITTDDFMVAGGILLFTFAVTDLLASGEGGSAPNPESLGAVPLGVPLMVGPAVLTTIILVSQYGGVPTVLAIVANTAIVGLSLWFSGAIVRVLGKTGSRAISKIVQLILAAIGVTMIRLGIMGMIHMAK